MGKKKDEYEGFQVSKWNRRTEMDSQGSSVLGPVKPKFFLPSLEDPAEPDPSEFYTPSAMSVLTKVAKEEEEKAQLVSQQSAYTVTAALTAGGATQYIFVIVFFNQMRYELVGQSASSSGYPVWYPQYSSKYQTGTITAFTVAEFDNWFTQYYPNFGTVFDHATLLAYPTLEQIKQQLYDIRNQWVVWQEYVPSEKPSIESGIGFPHLAGFNPVQYSGWFAYIPQMMFVAKDLTAQMWANTGKTNFLILGYNRDSVLSGITIPGVPMAHNKIDLCVYPLLDTTVYGNAPQASDIELINIKKALPTHYNSKLASVWTFQQAVDVGYGIEDWMGMTMLASDKTIYRNIGRSIANGIYRVTGSKQTMDDLAFGMRSVSGGDDLGMG